MKKLKAGIVIGILLMAIISVASAWIFPPPEPPEEAKVIFKNVTVEPTEGYAPLTVNIAGEVCNIGNISGDYEVVMTLINDKPVKMVIDEGILAPNESKSFLYNYTLTDNVTIVLTVWSGCCIPSDIYYVGITVLELDEDHDGWDDYVEQLIHKYYPEFDPVNETPTKDDVVQAIINAVKQYKTTPDLEQKMQIREDVRAIIKEYREELRKS